ncbi:hypothetical protein GCM10027040_10300 [Halomonas shantousis]
MADSENRVTPGTPSSAQPSGESAPTNGTASRGGSAKDNTKDQAREQTAQAKEQAKQKASGAKEQAREYVRHQADEARHQATGLFDRQKDMAADQVGNFATAFRSMADQFDEQGQASCARYVNTLAGNIDNLSGTLREQDVNTLMTQAKDFGRRRPALFLGGAVAAGVLLSRFLKSSGERDGETGGGRGGM